MFGRNIHLKLESLSPVRSFKFRGALIAMRHIAATAGPTSVVYTASTGNHGQGVAHAGSLTGLHTIVYAPENAVEEKLQAMRDLGADVRIHGAHLGESQHKAEMEADASGGVYLEDGESADLMAGASTVLSEVLSSDLDLDTVVVPIGGGNLIAGSLLSRALDDSDVEIIGVQSTAASAAVESWKLAGLVERSCDTFAGGLATTRPGNLALEVMVAYLERALLVDEADLYDGIATMLRSCGIQVEGAAASVIAALTRFGDHIPGDDVALVVTGSWASHSEITQALG
jgi:threonine dehydratase